MKIGMVALGLVLAAVFAVIAVAPMLDLQTEAEAIPGLDTSASGVFSNIGTFAVIFAGVIVIIFLIAAVAYAVKQR